MAAFYNYIKGYMSNGTTAQYIFFNQDAGENGTSIKDNRPYFSDKSSADTKHFLVSEDGNHTFTGTNIFGEQNTDGTPSSNNKTTSFLTIVNFENTTTFNIAPIFNKGATIKYSVDIVYDTNNKFIIKSDKAHLVTFSNGGDEKSKYVNFAQALSSDVSVTAPFFNASSDRRLKTNINAVEDSVLPLIVSTPVYTFNYKKHPTIPVIGIMAQDVLDKNINDFNLVKKSSGGYYEIKESKMIYILWKAVQEQQKQIEALQARLEGEVNGEAND